MIIKMLFPLIFFCNSGFMFENVLYCPVWFLRRDFDSVGGEASSSPLTINSFIVGGIYAHEDFGFCSFIGMGALNKQEMLCFQFGDGVVKIHISKIDKISFVSNGGERKLSSLHRGSLWKKTKGAAFRAAQNYAQELLSAYSKRELSKTLKFKTKDKLLLLFVRAFKFTDTPDQKMAWEDLLGDFEKNTPVNRLICGDVGFGKTEIAMRASFLTVLNGGGVIVLAPTTILVNQLFGCFSSRMSDFGVSVVSLVASSKNKDQIVSNFVNKSVDVLICTTAVLGFLGALRSSSLLIVDEEHRFGVKDKEAVFTINPSVHFISMSATPIPRTMQLALSRVRNISLINSPPILRKPIISQITNNSFSVIESAITQELSRSGLVYIVDSSVAGVRALASKIRSSFKGVNIEVIYSALGNESLSKIMDLFSNNKIQILLSTSIIESGIDVGAANTIVINNAHRFGLSQLYQLKGRVGRSHLQAFAWFLVPKNILLSSSATQRLSAIMRLSALGVGYKISQSDLEIRGSGALFGYKQSGSGGVGFELYSKLLAHALDGSLRGDVFLDCFVDIYNCSIPSSLIPSQGERAGYYKTIYSAKDSLALKKLRAGFVGFFGICPKELDCLIKNRELGLLGMGVGIKEILCVSGFVRVVFYSNLNKKYVGPLSTLLSFIESFLTGRGVQYSFIQSHKNLIFQYKKTTKDDYILLRSFINKLVDVL